jgi:signal transduction histidine kinase
MQSAPPPSNEAERLQSLWRLQILDTDAEEAFDNLTRLAAMVAGTEIALVSLVDADRQWFKSRHGLAATETHRTLAFCAHAILTPEQPFIVENAADDLRFHDNPLVAGAPDIRFYAGIPLRSPLDQHALGTLCAISPRSIKPSDEVIEQLKLIAGQVERLLALHVKNVDLSDQKRALEEANQKAERANAAKSRFLATISHDMRTPLSGLLGSMELLESQASTPAQRQLLRTAQDCGQVLEELVTDTLDLAKIESGTVELDTEAFGPGELLEQVARVVRPALSERPVDLLVDVDSTTPPHLRGDPRRVRQILLNLAGNAARFTQQGQIRLTSRWTKDRWVIAVSDTGPGIPSADLERIFEPFAQAAAGRKVENRGTGLGLSICQELTRVMGGSISCESELGQGTTFTLRLPLPVVQAQSTHTAPEVGRPLAVRRVLLAEDDRVCRMIASKLLEQLGFEVVQAADGEQALAALEEGGFDLALLDVWMPGMTGCEVAQQWRALEREGRLPIVGLTGVSGQDEVKDCIESGMDEVILKPLRRGILEARLGSMLAAQAS